MRLVDEERQRAQPAGDIVSRAAPSEDEVCADLGCGIGYVTIPLASRVRLVMALDSQAEMLSELMERADRVRDRILPTLAELPMLPVGDECLDRVVLVNVLHEVGDRAMLASEIARVLRPGGRLTVVDFQKRETSWGPPVSERIREEDVPVILLGFGTVTVWSFEEFYQYEFVRR